MIGLRYWSLANRGKLALTNDRVNSIKDTVEGDNSNTMYQIGYTTGPHVIITRYLVIDSSKPIGSFDITSKLPHEVTPPSGSASY